LAKCLWGLWGLCSLLAKLLWLLHGRLLLEPLQLIWLLVELLVHWPTHSRVRGHLLLVKHGSASHRVVRRRDLWAGAKRVTGLLRASYANTWGQCSNTWGHRPRAS
jgi:hypothetical protein